MFLESIMSEVVAGLIFLSVGAIVRRVEPSVRRLALASWQREVAETKSAVDVFRPLRWKGIASVALLTVPVGGVLMANAAMMDSAPFVLQIAGGVIVIVIMAHIVWRGGLRTIGKIRAQIQ